MGERTRMISRLRWHLHELEPGNEPAARTLNHLRNLDLLAERLAGVEGTVARIARDLVDALPRADDRDQPTRARDQRSSIEQLAPALLAICGCGALTAAKILGETAGIKRFKSPYAYARHNGTAPLPVWSSNRARHRLSRTGNRQLNAALHRIALTQARWPPRRTGAARPPTRQRRRRPRSPPRPQTPPLRRRLPRPTRADLTPPSPTPLDRGARDSLAVGRTQAITDGWHLEVILWNM